MSSSRRISLTVEIEFDRDLASGDFTAEVFAEQLTPIIRHELLTGSTGAPDTAPSPWGMGRARVKDAYVSVPTVDDES